MKSILLIGVLLTSTLSLASAHSGSIEGGGDFLIYGPTCKLMKKLPQRFHGTGTFEFLVSEDQKTLTINSRQLESGNCSQGAADNMPRALQLTEGQVLQIPLNPKGASAISGTKNTNFFASWSRTADGSVRIYGGCNWEYNCAGAGHSEVSILTSLSK